MPKVSPFEENTYQYDSWFLKNPWVYDAELRAVKAMVPVAGRGLEVGVGTGRFAQPLAIREGVEPSSRMREIAQRRGIRVVDGVAEALPFESSTFDFVLMVTVLCFVDDVHEALLEAKRVLVTEGVAVIGFIDRDGKMGEFYLKHQRENPFYREAKFLSTAKLIEYMDWAGFTDLTLTQTIFGTLDETSEDEPVKPGYGEGSFVVARGKKPE
jgi:SAM-dependent methyltransferase